MHLTVHGREALRLPITSDTTDLSTRTLFLEVAGSTIRVALDLDPAVATGRIAHLSRDEVATLPMVPTLFAIIDETDPASPFVLVPGTIERTGFTR